MFLNLIIPDVLKFNYNLEQELFKLQAELQTKAYSPSDYKTNVVYTFSRLIFNQFFNNSKSIKY